ncbi:MAG: hypothetical protein K6F27_09720 [Ruminococcus sp.]|nr:hypothetical protein [Ruminococcus sp.]
MAYYVYAPTSESITDNVVGYGLTDKDGQCFEITEEEALNLCKLVYKNIHTKEVVSALKEREIDISVNSDKFGKTEYPTYKVDKIVSAYENYLEGEGSAKKEYCLKAAILSFLMEDEKK